VLLILEELLVVVVPEAQEHQYLAIIFQPVEAVEVMAA
jgi:hypothetical protein